MPVETAADRAMFLSADDFGTTARYLPQIGAETTLTGIFDNAHLMVDAGDAGVSGTAPVFHCRTQDLEALPMGNAQRSDRLFIGAVEYGVNDIQPDGTGMTTLILEQKFRHG